MNIHFGACYFFVWVEILLIGAMAAAMFIGEFFMYFDVLNGTNWLIATHSRIIVIDEP